MLPHLHNTAEASRCQTAGRRVLEAESEHIFFFSSSSHKHQILFQAEPFASFFVFDCMFVCFVQLQQNKGSGFHSATVKKLSNVPTALRMPTNESKACCKQTKRV